MPVPVIIFLAFAVLAHLVLRYTRYGRRVYAVGGNPEAARLSGLDVDRLTSSVYVIIGFMAGLGGFVLSARLNSAEAVAGLGYELTVIASVVIGGTSLFGGIGTVFGTVVGTLLIGVLLNGLVLNNVAQLRPAGHHRRDHRAGGGVRHLRQVAKAAGLTGAYGCRTGRSGSGRSGRELADLTVLLGQDVDLAGLVLAEAQVDAAVRPADQLQQGDRPAAPQQGQLPDRRLRAQLQAGSPARGRRGR